MRGQAGYPGRKQATTDRRTAARPEPGDARTIGWPDPDLGTEARWVEEARLLRIEEGDRLAVTLSNNPDEETATAIVDGIAEWSGLPRDRIVLLAGADLTILRPGEDP